MHRRLFSVPFMRCYLIGRIWSLQGIGFVSFFWVSCKLHYGRNKNGVLCSYTRKRTNQSHSR